MKTEKDGPFEKSRRFYEGSSRKYSEGSSTNEEEEGIPLSGPSTRDVT